MAVVALVRGELGGGDGVVGRDGEGGRRVEVFDGCLFFGGNIIISLALS